MDIFISWSGRRSLAVAQGIREWLPLVLQYTRPYVSSDDIRKGNRWSLEIGAKLDGTNYGIVCLFPENVNADWILFESGALSKAVGAGALWTLLGGGLRPADLTGPLSQFQHTVTERDDVLKLLRSIDAEAADTGIGDARLTVLFDQLWPRLHEAVSAAEGMDANEPVEPARGVEVLVEEILGLTRETARTLASFAPMEEGWTPKIDEFFTRIHVQPTQDEELLHEYRRRCAEHPLLRGSARSMGMGGVGVAPDGDRILYDHMQIQSYRPPSRQALLEVAQELGLEIIDITYDIRRKSR